MKITIEFDDAEDVKMALDAWAYRQVIVEIDNTLRSITKHSVSILGKEFCDDTEYDVAEKLRDKIRDFLFEYNIRL